MTVLQQLWRNNEGQSISEYALMLTLILLIVAGTVSAIGGSAEYVFEQVAGALSTG